MTLSVKDPESPASAKQVGYIMSLAVKAKIPPSLFEEMFGIENPAELTKGEASVVIERLKNEVSGDVDAIDVDGEWATSPASEVADSVMDTAATKASPVTMPSRPEPGHWKGNGGKPKAKPLPAGAPNKPGLYFVGGPDHRAFSVQESKSGNIYALEWNANARDWEYDGQTTMRKGELTKAHQVGGNVVRDFMDAEKTCPACKKLDVNGKHTCNNLTRWGL